MNPLLSLVIVILGLLIFLKGLQWIKIKLPNFALFGKKQREPYLNMDENIQILNQFALDEHYKIVTLMLSGEKQSFLLGPTQALKLDNDTSIKSEDTKLFHLKTRVDTDIK